MYEHATSDPAATLIVLADGHLGRNIARLAQRHADFDPDCRRVLRPGDAVYPTSSSIVPWKEHGAAALVVNAGGEVCALLDERQATTEAWIEDAFVRGRRRCAIQ